MVDNNQSNKIFLFQTTGRSKSNYFDLLTLLNNWSRKCSEFKTTDQSMFIRIWSLNLPLDLFLWTNTKIRRNYWTDSKKYDMKNNCSVFVKAARIYMKPNFSTKLTSMMWYLSRILPNSRHFVYLVELLICYFFLGKFQLSVVWGKGWR